MTSGSWGARSEAWWAGGGGDGMSDSTGPARVLLDCRWAGIGGVGRVTEMVLSALDEIPVPWHWLVWGDVEAPSGAIQVPGGENPLRSAGMAGYRRVPRHDAAVFLHALKPLTRRKNVTVIYDTIPIRFAEPRPRRLGWRCLYTASAWSATRVMTCSGYAASQISADTLLPAHRVGVLPMPADPQFVDRVRAIRERSDSMQPYVLYVGQIAPHKNLVRLVEGFRMSDFADDGGRLRLVGGRPTAINSLRTVLDGDAAGVDIVPRLPDSTLAEELAGARLLVLPSLEEGFGLPAVEALEAGVPVAVSDRPWADDSVGLGPYRFDPTNPASIAAALDGALSAPAEDTARRRDEFREHRGTVTPRSLVRALAMKVGELLDLSLS